MHNVFREHMKFEQLPHEFDKAETPMSGFLRSKVLVKEFIRVLFLLVGCCCMSCGLL